MAAPILWLVHQPGGGDEAGLDDLVPQQQGVGPLQDGTQQVEGGRQQGRGAARAAKGDVDVLKVAGRQRAEELQHQLDVACFVLQGDRCKLLISMISICYHISFLLYLFLVETRLFVFSTMQIILHYDPCTPAALPSYPPTVLKC